MLLAIDIGNSNIVIGIFQGNELKADWRIATDLHRTADEYAAILMNLIPMTGIDGSMVNEAIMCSVVPHLELAFSGLCRRYFGVSPLVVEAGTKTGVRVLTDNPREVGADRVVNAAAAHHLYGGPLIVIDFGTATTFDTVSIEGDYMGGAIAPGINIAAEALFSRTAKLPQVEPVRPKNSIGRNTITAIQSGIFFGYIGMVEGIVARMTQEIGGTVRTVATGGYADIMAQETPVIQAVNPNLTLIGLRLINDMNRGQFDARA
ncbi:MAG: type III pantothenate kinase [Dehalococcoidia bacterium]|jgi:type III pantothenate kinase|nr:type III pantothenate kinase [Dehalococcoidia bacterium]MDP7469976.1 type III pantothenate kinase [Dehalococcoidia bacterium]